ncbi:MULTISPECIES: UDP-N-acetylmuramate dehydrogenase [unclassified Solwaraspora]|uniref:UDP-N-acetylmuramate dehydrogenase n=1 Tax=unclassified Solwaraspora TaxID=2627926 RepID=UPI00248B7935|nr:MULTISPECIES: UDP-N-acetylmuramate dehydrogenase [unclassified Solwaraspora]WBB97598.1 UDP-N-acetylmuramate dehydrogenase [Solwaraspora sp. WMMA2059]WBC18509.1 UDP-N-acetylmuramate dehydrogenase [Solwaraspora sp. WMMA2080]WJK34078.1 UDP-N-acetylmuramate dehydrogenase [Solwaraspora sp. WMMA2065]
MPDVSAHAPSAEDPTALAPLARYTTLALGGPADRLVTATTADELTEAVRDAGRRGEQILLLSGGSNVVIGDDGFPGTVILVRSTGFQVVTEEPARAGGPATVTIRVEAGEPWDDLVAATVAAGWSGVECLSGIPGAAGATPIQNVGAYGQEVAETVQAVHVHDRLTDERYALPAADCRFAYRDSLFKRNDRYLVLAVDFQLARSELSTPVRYAELARSLGVAVGDRVPLADARAAVLRLRAGKGMVLDATDPDTRSVGSFFTNPVLDAAAARRFHARVAAAGTGEPATWPVAGGDAVKVSAAWLIDKAGYGKGYPGGDAPVAISSKHTLALTHRGGGSTAALLDLAGTIRDGVRDRFGVALHPEPVLINCSFD